MPNSSEVFKQNFDKSIGSIPKLEPEVMMSLNKMKDDVTEEEVLKGGLADNKSLEDLAKKHNVELSDIEKQFEIGLKKEKEHTSNNEEAEEIVMDHLYEDPKYYNKLKKVEGNEATGSGSSGAYSAPLFSGEEPKKVEATEATGSGSVGAYESPAAWAKSTKKKDWRGKSHTQIPGGAFVSVKKKCKSFPYCNKGDISALHIYENEVVKEAIDNVSKKLNISETTIKAIIEFELEKTMKQSK
jgi:hypothetical protein